MFYVYLIRSIDNPDRVYVGYTANIIERMQDHNVGGTLSTKDFAPWELIVNIGFKNKSRAKDFELYLKSHSGRAFLNKRLI